MLRLNYIGALTSKVYSFRARPWELKNFVSIDFFDSLCSSILVSIRGTEILRILPKFNISVNGFWISDKIRFCYDALKNQRLLYPMAKNKNFDFKFINLTWENVFLLLLKIFSLNGQRNLVKVFLGNFLELESIVIVKDIFNKLGSNLLYSYLNLQKSIIVPFMEFRNKFLFNCKLTSLEKLDLLVFCGINPRFEIPVLNLKLKKLVNNKEILIFSFGYIYNLTYKLKNLGNSLNKLLGFFEGKLQVSKFLVKCKSSFLFVGISLLLKENFFLFFNNFKTFFSTFLKINTGILFLYVNDIILLELNLINLGSLVKKRFKLLYIFDHDEIIFNKNYYNFIIYQGHHGDINALNSDLILPGATLFEKIGTFINLEGIVQQSRFIINPTKYIRNDIKILKNLALLLNLNLVKNIINRILDFLPFLKFFFTRIGYKYVNSYIYNNSTYKLYLNNLLNLNIINSKLYNFPITSFLVNFYLNNNITRFSVVMALCSNRFIINKFINFIVK